MLILQYNEFDVCSYLKDCKGTHVVATNSLKSILEEAYALAKENDNETLLINAPLHIYEELKEIDSENSINKYGLTLKLERI